MELEIDTSWKIILKDEFAKDYFKNLIETIKKSYEANICYPAYKDIFKAFTLSDFNKTRVVILGQDPYHGEKQAQGLSFSVPENQKLPPSLRNIYKELKDDLGIDKGLNGDLQDWAKQGVLLLNSSLTVEASRPGSHQGMGWEEFTDNVIKNISDKKENVVFILWGKYAEAKKDLIDNKKHLIITSPHPSPFSAHRGFFGSKPFSKTNEYFKSKNKTPIKW